MYLSCTTCALRGRGRDRDRGDFSPCARRRLSPLGIGRAVHVHPRPHPMVRHGSTKAAHDPGGIGVVDRGLEPARSRRKAWRAAVLGRGAGGDDCEICRDQLDCRIVVHTGGAARRRPAPDNRRDRSRPGADGDGQRGHRPGAARQFTDLMAEGLRSHLRRPGQRQGGHHRGRRPLPQRGSGLEGAHPQAIRRVQQALHHHVLLPG